MKVNIKAYVYELDFGTGDKSYCIFNTENSGDSYYTLVGPVEVEYEIPASFNPIAAKVAALKQSRADAIKAHAQTLAIFDEQISKLLCITLDEVTA